MNIDKAARLFYGFNETLILSCLQGHMGSIICDNSENPTSAVIDIGDFCFFSGLPTTAFFRFIDGFKLLIPLHDGWEQVIEEFYTKRVRKMNRYAIKKEPEVFNREKLKSFVNSLSNEYTCSLFNREIYDMAMSEPWSVDMCSLYNGYSDYASRGLGVAILKDGVLVSGASSYSIYDGGIEIEIDTRTDHRQKGLATVCGARLILECLDRGLYPSWDAYDLRSVALSEKLGYHLDYPYVTYELKK